MSFFEVIKNLLLNRKYYCPRCGHSFRQLSSCPKCDCSEQEIRLINDANIKNSSDTVKSLFIAAVKGDAQARRKLGVEYYNGKLIVKSTTLAYYWLKKAALQGDVEAFGWVGYFYYNGIGVQKNIESAIIWYQKGAAANNKNCIYNLDKIQPKINKKTLFESEASQVQIEKESKPIQQSAKEVFQVKEYNNHSLEREKYLEEDRKKREQKYQELLKKSEEATKQYKYKIKEIIDKRNKEDEALIKKNNQNISWNKKNLDRFVIDHTEKLNGSTIYHESYGEGKFEFLEKGNNGYVYIHINFQGYGDKKFIYKGELPNVLSLEMPKSLQSNLRVEKARFEFENKQEEEFFNKVSKHVAEQLDVARYHEQLAGYDFNDFTDSYNENIFDDMTKLHENVSELSAIARSPYFARIDYNQQSPCTLYFGKRAVQGYVTDWRDKRAIMYYQYKLFIDNKDINLSLVRDINIVSGIYRGFNDKFSSKEIMQKGDQVEKIIADDFLIQIIENERASHRIHDIVESIQKKQYEIIIENCENDIVVNGCAGSGKTAVLFHKLSYLIFNNPDISLKNIYVISPTNALNLESDELAKELQINAVQRLIIGDFYTNIFVEYCKKYDVFFEESTDTLLKDEKLDDGVAKIIYSKKTITEFVRNIKKILKHGLPAKIAFTEEYNKLIKKFENIAPLNLVAKIKSLKKAIKEAKKESKTRPNNERKLELMNFILNNYECVGIPQYKDTKNNKSKIEINSDAIKEASDEFDKFTKRICKFNGKSLDTKEVLKIILDHRNCAQNASLYEQFVNGDNLCYAAYVINSEIEKFKRMHNIGENNYEFEAFYRVAAMQSLFGKLSEEKIYIYLDEYQNYALEEIFLIQKVYGSITWNLFGDMNQKILDKGSRVLRAEKFNWKTFDMNQNYRNAKEITEYANNKFWLSMIPIGIEGSVRELSLKKLGQINEDYISDGRVAIIIKNEDTISLDYVKDIFHTNREFNVVSDDSNALQEDKINIITVSMSKGLEFENVVVFEKGMTRNEKYVACTRALKNLIVVVK